MRRLLFRFAAFFGVIGLLAAVFAAPAAAAPLKPPTLQDAINALVPTAPAKPAPKDAPRQKAPTPSTPAPSETSRTKATPTPPTTVPGNEPATVTPAAEIRPGVPAFVTLTDGSQVALSPNATNVDLVTQLKGLRERLTAAGMDLLNRLMSLIPGLNPPSNSKPVLTVTPTAGLKSGSTVTVSGSGYRAGENVYITQTIAKPASGYPSTYADAKKVTISGDGTFSTSLKLVTTFSSVDCTKTECFVASFTAFPKLTDRSQDAWTPISFTGGTIPGTQPPATGSNPPASGGPRVSVSPTTGLNPAGDSVTVTGSGFSTSGPGIYVGIAQTDQFSATDQSSFGPNTVFVSTSRGNLKSDGSFSVPLSVSAKFNRADCTTNACAVYTFAAHGSSDRSQDTATGVSFVGGPQARGTVNVPSDGGASRAQPTTNNGPRTASVSVSTTTIAPTGTTSVTVSGSGFATEGPGVYVGVAQTDRFSTTDAGSFGAVTWVPSTMMSNGSFTTTLDVSPVFGAGNCIENACAIYTFAAHGSSDRSQDTATPISVAGADAEKKKADEEKKKEEAKKAAQKKAAASTVVAAPGADNDSNATATTPTAASGDDSTDWWPWALGGGAVVAAAAAGAYAVRRRP